MKTELDAKKEELGILKEMTLIADLWIADKNKQVKQFDNEGILIRRTKANLKTYEVSVYVTHKKYPLLDTFNKGWETRSPHAVITKANGTTDAYELTFKGVKDAKGMKVLQFSGVKVQ